VTEHDYPTLANFFACWFTNDHDFDELESVLNLMRRLNAQDNLRDLQDEIRQIKTAGIPLAEFNAFSLANEGRKFTAARYADFLNSVLAVPAGLEA
jgi:hypothetical protein